jgi:hypothetical protein
MMALVSSVLGPLVLFSNSDNIIQTLASNGILGNDDPYFELLFAFVTTILAFIFYLNFQLRKTLRKQNCFLEFL